MDGRRAPYLSDLADAQWKRIAPLLPHDFPPWGTVHYYFRRWRLDGTWQHIHDTLHAAARRAAGREASPSAAIIDSQSVKTTEKGTAWL